MKENNKLLADFLGLQTIEFHSNLYLATQENFDLMDSLIWNPRLDWNQLMRVIEKIKSIKSYDRGDVFSTNVTLKQTECVIESGRYNFKDKFYDPKLYFKKIVDLHNLLSSTYTNCINYVKWYNLNKK